MDGVKRIGDRQDSGSQRNVGSSDTVGVARSIPPFVMMGDENRGVLHEHKGLEQIGSEPGMMLNGDIGLGLERRSALGDAG